MIPRIPVTARRSDWPRLAANAFNRLDAQVALIGTGGGSGTFSLDDGTATASGVFSFDEGGA